MCNGVSTCSCQNGGVCVASSTSTGAISYACSCPTNYGGNLCQYVKSTFQSCQNTPCLNGGYCTIFSTCSCPSGFTGTFCETSSNTILTTLATTTTSQFSLTVCSAGICLNGGTCMQITNSLAMCNCVSPYYGLYCNLQPSAVTTTVSAVTTTLSTAATTLAPVTTLNFCSSSPCQNNGGCLLTDAVNGRCLCQAAFTGTFCETGFSCSNFFCATGQTCQLVNNLPMCITIVG